MNVSELRSNIYNLIDSVIATGKPIDFEHNGSIVRIQLLAEPKPKKKKLTWRRRKGLVCSPEDLDNFSWEFNWSELSKGIK